MRDFPNSYPKPDWLPNWRSEAAYEDHGEYIDEWAWECLRRNPEYQADYAQWNALPDTELCEDGRSRWSSKTGLSLGTFTPMAFCYGEVPALGPAETAGAYEARTGIWPVTLYVHLCRKWGVLDPISPASPNPPEWYSQGEPSRSMPPYDIPEFDDTFSISGFKPGYEDRRGRLLYAWWPEEDDAYLSKWAFDLRLNIEDQIDLVRDVLKEMQAEAKSPDPIMGREALRVARRPSAKGISTLLTDLRILDAKWAGATDIEIIEVLWGSPAPLPYDDGGAFEASRRKADEQKVKDAMRRMVDRVMNGGWEELVLWSQLPQSQKNRARKASVAE